MELLPQNYHLYSVILTLGPSGISFLHEVSGTIDPILMKLFIQHFYL